MSSFKKVLRECNVDCLHQVVENDGQRFLCFTRLGNSENSWIVVVTNGTDVWKNEYDEEGLEALSDLVNARTTDTFLTRFRQSFTLTELSVTQVGTKMTFTVGKGATCMGLDLFETTAADKKLELQKIIFHLADKTSILETKLLTAEQSLEKLRTQKPVAVEMNALMTLSPKKGGQSKAKPPKVGMSVVNPASRKRKIATGVVFE